MKRFVRPTSSLVALGVLLVAIAAGIASPRVLAILHHYSDFISVGRSSVKVASLALYALLVFGLALFTLPITPKRLAKALTGALYAALTFSMLSTIGMVALIAKLQVPFRSSFYAVNGDEFSFGHLAHSHLFRPIGSLVGTIAGVEGGGAWFAVLQQFFGIPGWMLIAFYVIVGCVIAWLAILGIAYASRQKGVALKILTLLATAMVSKSLLDGSFLDLSALVGIATLGLLLRNRFLALLPIPFLIIDYFLWFTPEFLPQLALLVALMAGIYLLHLTGTQKGRRRVIAGTAACTLLLLFIIGGARIPFFGMDAGEHVAQLPSEETRTVPAHADVYFTRKGALWPEHVTTTADESVSSFLASHEAYFENYRESIRIAGANCNPDSTRNFSSRIRIFTPAGRATSTVNLPPWITSRVDVYRETTLKHNDCMPNTLVTVLRGIKTLYPDEPIVISFIK